MIDNPAELNAHEVRVLLKLQGLPHNDELVDRVRRNLLILAAQQANLLSQPLDVTIEPAPTFRP